MGTTISTTTKGKGRPKTAKTPLTELLSWATVPAIRGTAKIPTGPEPVRKLLAAIRRNLRGYMKNYEEDHNRERGRYLLLTCRRLLVKQVGRHGVACLPAVCETLTETVVKLPFYRESNRDPVLDHWVGNE